jgi:hypothetical protein
MKFSRLLITLLILATSLAAAAKPCPPFKVYGLIAQRWATLGGADGFLGCPTSDETSMPGTRARLNSFERGGIVWSPDQGPNMVISAYWRLVPGNPPTRIFVEWGDASPFHYDFFLVRPNAVNRASYDPPLDQQWEIHSGGSRGSSDFIASGGGFSISIEGCDSHGLAPSICHQGWTKPVILNMPFVPPYKAPAGPPVEHPIISVRSGNSGASAAFAVTGTGFKDLRNVTVRITDAVWHMRTFNITTTVKGEFNTTHPIPCNSGLPMSFVATDGTPIAATIDNTGEIWSNTVTLNCP